MRKQVCVHTTAWHVFMCVHMNMFSFRLSSQAPYSPSKQEEYYYFPFYFDSSHLQKSCLLRFLPWRTISSDGPGKDITAGEGMQMEHRIRPGGPRCALCVRNERKKKPPPPKCLYLCLNDWRVSQNSRFCATGSTRSALLTQIHPVPYHLEGIMGNAWRGSLTPPKGSPVASRVAALNTCGDSLLGLRVLREDRGQLKTSI